MYLLDLVIHSLKLKVKKIINIKLNKNFKKLENTIYYLGNYNKYEFGKIVNENEKFPIYKLEYFEIKKLMIKKIVCGGFVGKFMIFLTGFKFFILKVKINELFRMW
jgi:hypothetical protein